MLYFSKEKEGGEYMVLPDLFIDVTSLMVLCFFFNKICTKKRIRRKIYEATTHPIYRSVHRINSFMSLYTFLANRTLSFDHWTVHVTTSDISFQLRQNKTNTIYTSCFASQSFFPDCLWYASKISNILLHQSKCK